MAVSEKFCGPDIGDMDYVYAGKEFWPGETPGWRYRRAGHLVGKGPLTMQGDKPKRLSIVGNDLAERRLA